MCQLFNMPMCQLFNMPVIIALLPKLRSSVFTKVGISNATNKYYSIITKGGLSNSKEDVYNECYASYMWLMTRFYV